MLRHRAPSCFGTGRPRCPPSANRRAARSGEHARSRCAPGAARRGAAGPASGRKATARAGPAQSLRVALSKRRMQGPSPPKLWAGTGRASALGRSLAEPRSTGRRRKHPMAARRTQGRRRASARGKSPRKASARVRRSLARIESELPATLAQFSRRVQAELSSPREADLPRGNALSGELDPLAARGQPSHRTLRGRRRGALEAPHRPRPRRRPEAAAAPRAGDRAPAAQAGGAPEASGAPGRRHPRGGRHRDLERGATGSAGTGRLGRWGRLSR